MSKTIVIVGFGPGISTAVARKFGAEGFSVALVARNNGLTAEEGRLAEGVAMLRAAGISAAAFPADAGDPEAIATALGEASTALGPIMVIHWNAFGGLPEREAGDIMAANAAAVRGVFDIAVVGLLAAIQAALPDLTSTGEGAVLVTNGAFADTTPQMDEYAVSLKSMGVALANAAKHKLVGLLSQRLKGEGVYVGEVMVAGTIQGTPWDTGSSIDPSIVAEKFWELYQARGAVRARVSE